MTIKQMKVKEIMTKNVITTTKDKTAYHIAKLMEKHNIGSVIIANKDKIEGIITEKDLVRKVIALNICPSNIKAKDIMTTNLITGVPDQTVAEVNRILNLNNIRRLPIIEDGRLVGIVTTTDLIRQVY